MSHSEDAFDYLDWLNVQVDAHAVGLPRNEDHVRTWQGILFAVDGRRMLVALDEVRAIVTPPRQVMLPGAKPWVVGLANLRGELTGVFDLARFWFDTASPASRHSVVFLAKHAQAASAFLVERSYGIRQVPYGEERPLSESTHHGDLAALAGFHQEVRLNDEWLPVLEFRSLLENDQFLNAVA
ncbi:chemotaxis protein CheW [Guyparkeria hydrothermalis]|uniref:chemotaxis protein CheW n=1 Tax=Guyparkeria hydrothermalis TaxID=923 RepID=UPI002020000F|nr:chemotaxis protein CheW [Guyparkeria hydrothermalis]MCL7745124.1 chemotaxis protein CheW [Guyparkeria hydrothermalis]